MYVVEYRDRFLWLRDGDRANLYLRSVADFHVCHYDAGAEELAARLRFHAVGCRLVQALDCG